MSKRKKKKTAVRFILMYVVLTAGLWMFMLSYTNSYNKLTTEKISPAALVLKSETAEMTILEKKYSFSIVSIMPESRLYYILYLSAPEEVRTYLFLISLLYRQ